MNVLQRNSKKECFNYKYALLSCKQYLILVRLSSKLNFVAVAIESVSDLYRQHL